jgi:hypothetical protein
MSSIAIAIVIVVVILIALFVWQRKPAVVTAPVLPVVVLDADSTAETQKFAGKWYRQTPSGGAKPNSYVFNIKGTNISAILTKNRLVATDGGMVNDSVNELIAMTITYVRPGEIGVQLIAGATVRSLTLQLFDGFMQIVYPVTEKTPSYVERWYRSEEQALK